MSAKGIGTGARTAAAALLVAATAAGVLAGCGHYGPPLRAKEYRDKAAAEQAAERQRAQGQQPGETPAQDDKTEGVPAPDPREGAPHGLEAP